MISVKDNRIPLFFLAFVLAITNSLTINAQNTIFWEISHPQQDHKSYLLGTYHQLGNWFADSLTVVKEKLLTSELAIFEAIADDSAVQKVILNREDAYAYREVLKKKYVAQLEAMSIDWKYPLQKMSPMEVLVKIQQDYYRTHCGNSKPSDTWSHFDDYLIHLAREQGISLYGLETNEKQVEMLNESIGSWKEVKKDVKEWLKDWDDPDEEAENCIFSRNYRKMNLEYYLESECPDDIMIKGRNAMWMPQLLKLLKEQSTFVAVGLYHLYWDCGLISELRKEGYTLTPLQSLDE